MQKTQNSQKMGISSDVFVFSGQDCNLLQNRPLLTSVSVLESLQGTQYNSNKT